jgi:hypothetical protein
MKPLKKTFDSIDGAKQFGDQFDQRQLKVNNQLDSLCTLFTNTILLVINPSEVYMTDPGETGCIRSTTS